MAEVEIFHQSGSFHSKTCMSITGPSVQPSFEAVIGSKIKPCLLLQSLVYMRSIKSACLRQSTYCRSNPKAQRHPHSREQIEDLPQSRIFPFNVGCMMVVSREVLTRLVRCFS